MPENKTSLEKVMKNAKDIIYIIMFLAVALGWLRNSTKDKTTMTITIENNTKAIENNTKAYEKFNEYMLENNKFNGQVLQHLKENP